MENYNGGISLISGLKQANNANFPLMATDQIMAKSDGTRLDKYLEDLQVGDASPSSLDIIDNPNDWYVSERGSAGATKDTLDELSLDNSRTYTIYLISDNSLYTYDGSTNPTTITLQGNDSSDNQNYKNKIIKVSNFINSNGVYYNNENGVIIVDNDGDKVYVNNFYRDMDQYPLKSQAVTISSAQYYLDRIDKNDTEILDELNTRFNNVDKNTLYPWSRNTCIYFVKNKNYDDTIKYTPYIGRYGETSVEMLSVAGMFLYKISQAITETGDVITEEHLILYNGEGWEIELAGVSGESYDDTEIKSDIAELEARTNAIEYGTKLVREGTQEYFFATNKQAGGTTFGAGVNMLTVFTDIDTNGDSVSLVDGILKLKAGLTYSVSIGFVSAVGTANVQLRNKDGDTSYYGNNSVMARTAYTDIPINAIISADTDLELICVSDVAIEVYNLCNYIKITVLNPYAIDPLTYVDEQVGISDTPVGTVFEMLSTNVVPNGYLPTDGRELQIGDYPYLEEYFKEAFGTVNYYGGDGVTTYQLPEYMAEKQIEFTMTGATTDGITVDQSTSWQTSQLGWRAFDGSIADGYTWVTAKNDTNPQWLSIDFGKPVTFNAFKYYPRTTYIYSDLPKFTLMGSNDGVNWDTLEVVSTPSYTTAEWYTIQLNDTYTYSQYKLDDMSPFSGYSVGTFLEVHELQFWYFYPSKIIKAEPTHYFNLNTHADTIYSEEERIIGSYKNKPLYQKTYWFDNLARLTSSAGSMQLADISDLGIETIVDYNTLTTGNTGLSITNGYGDTTNAVNIYVYPTVIGIGARSATSEPYSVIVTLRYTKINSPEVDYRQVGIINYFLDEQIIGTWVDGRTLYQKTIDVAPLPAVNQTKAIDIGLTTNDLVVEMTGTATRADGILTVPLPNVKTDISMWIENDSGLKLKIQPVDVNRTDLTQAFVTIKYVKG